MFGSRNPDRFSHLRDHSDKVSRREVAKAAAVQGVVASLSTAVHHTAEVVPVAPEQRPMPMVLLQEVA